MTCNVIVECVKQDLSVQKFSLRKLCLWNEFMMTSWTSDEWKNNIFWDSIFKCWIWQLMIVLLFERAGNFNVQKPLLKREVHKLCTIRPLPWKIWWHESLIFWDLFFVNYVNTLMYVVLKMNFGVSSKWICIKLIFVKVLLVSDRRFSPDCYQKYLVHSNCVH